MEESNDWNADKYSKNADFVSKLAGDVVTLLCPQKSENILDLGCGDGSLTQEIQKYCSHIVGVDLSADMVKKSKERGLEAYIMSATELTFHKKFDAVFSNAVLHWVQDASLAIASIKGVLKENGRFVGEFGGDKNIKALREAMQQVFVNHLEYGIYRNPWFFPDKKQYKQLLEKGGFHVNSIELIKRPTPIGDIKEWLNIFANGIMQNIPQEYHESFKTEVEEMLKPQLYSEKNGWVVDYVRLRFYATKVSYNEN